MFLSKTSNRPRLRRLPPTLNLTINLTQLFKRRINRPLSRFSTTVHVIPRFRYTLNPTYLRHHPRTTRLLQLRKRIRRSLSLATRVTTYQTSRTIRPMIRRQFNRPRIPSNTRGRLIPINTNTTRDLRHAIQRNRLAQQRRNTISVRGSRFLFRFPVPVRQGDEPDADVTDDEPDATWFIQNIQLHLPPPYLQFIIFLQTIPFQLPRIQPTLPRHNLQLTTIPRPSPFH